MSLSISLHNLNRATVEDHHATDGSSFSVVVLSCETGQPLPLFTTAAKARAIAEIVNAPDDGVDQ